MAVLNGRKISKGAGEGEVLKSETPISFLGGVDPATGNITEVGHPLNGQSIKGKVFVFPTGKGSTVGSYVVLQLKKNGTAPAAIVNEKAEPIIAVGAIISGIPMVDKIDASQLKTGQRVVVDADNGKIEVK